MCGASEIIAINAVIVIGGRDDAEPLLIRLKASDACPVKYALLWVEVQCLIQRHSL